MAFIFLGFLRLLADFFLPAMCVSSQLCPSGRSSDNIATAVPILTKTKSKSYLLGVPGHAAATLDRIGFALRSGRVGFVNEY